MLCTASHLADQDVEAQALRQTNCPLSTGVGRLLAVAKLAVTVTALREEFCVPLIFLNLNRSED